MNVWTGGTFSLLHPGHVALFQECARLAGLASMRPGRMVTAAVNTDDFVEAYKSERPVQTLEERRTMVSAIRWVNQVQDNDGYDQPGLILAADTDLIVVGDDWQHRDYLRQLDISAEWLNKHHIDVQYVPRVGGLSSTELTSRIRA